MLNYSTFTISLISPPVDILETENSNFKIKFILPKNKLNIALENFIFSLNKQSLNI